MRLHIHALSAARGEALYHERAFRQSVYASVTNHSEREQIEPAVPGRSDVAGIRFAKWQFVL